MHDCYLPMNRGFAPKLCRAICTTRAWHTGTFGSRTELDEPFPMECGGTCTNLWLDRRSRLFKAAWHFSIEWVKFWTIRLHKERIFFPLNIPSLPKFKVEARSPIPVSPACSETSISGKRKFSAEQAGRSTLSRADLATELFFSVRSSCSSTTRTNP